MARDSKNSTTKYQDSPSEEDPTLSDDELEDDEQGGTSGGEQQAGQNDEDEYSEAEEAKSEASSNNRARSATKATKVYDDDESDDNFDVPASKKARRGSGSTSTAVTKKAKGKGKGRAGKLEYFQSMPLDVLCEIAGHLDPVTLLAMSRVSKSFRSLFMSKSSKSIWHLARRNVFLPDLQAEDMSEAAYASLVFERSCMVCGKPRASIVDYFIRARWCRSCKKTNLIAQNSFRSLKHPQTLACMPFTLISLTGQNRSQRHYFFKPATLKLDTKLVELQAAADEAAAKESSSSKGKGKGKQKAVIEDDEEGEGENPAAVLRAFIKARKEIVTNATADGTAIFKWERSSAAERKASNLDLRAQRRDAVKQKVLALGHDARDCNFWGTANLVDQPRPLTDAIWNKISASVIAEVVRNASNRQQREIAHRQRQRSLLIGPLYHQMLDALPAGIEKAIFPPLAVFVDLPSVQQHWKPEQPDGYTIDQGLWLASLDDILANVEQRKKEDKVRYFVKFARPLLGAKVPFAELEQLIEKAEPKWDPIVKRNLPPIIAEEEMEALFAHPLARLRCSSGTNCASSSFDYAEIRLHEYSQHGGANYSTFGSAKWISTLRKLIGQAGLNEGKFEESQLEQLGEVWECRGCAASGTRAYTPWGAPSAPLIPVKKTNLTWGELVSHAYSQHSSYFRYDYAAYYLDRQRTPMLTMMGVADEQVEEAAAAAEAGPLSPDSEIYLSDLHDF
ncbi:hypothetical protein BCR35DRAFT_350866 [Leucosporidium creatinivorum]|uniref:F-box domain-containing protein n=1 Tax=Leucosporidium creatinivorum TaxID=106004 RepID=A0A1Y2G138_9BASI|nr:hypothetical protein BCR35DRAFT_350866 [Leucosporidium creatinivorum]